MNKIIEYLKNIQSFIVPFLCLLLFFTWGAKSSLEHALEDLALREITVIVKTESGQPISDTGIGIEPKYSFDEIKPKWRMTPVGVGQTRIAIVFVRHFKVTITAPGYYGQSVECADDSATELLVFLKKI